MPMLDVGWVAMDPMFADGFEVIRRKETINQWGESMIQESKMGTKYGVVTQTEPQGFERKEIANTQTPGSSMVPADSFRDPYLLDFLGLQGAYDERDLEDAIVHDLQEFLLEVGNGWAFVARQKRMTIDNDDFYLDLLFYSRPLRRLIAVELKVGRFKAAYEGQMKLYLKWLNRYERREDEEAPIGLILCTEASREQVEMLEMHKDGIVVAEYWTALPPKAELQARIQAIYRAAMERVARRELEPSGDGDA